MKKTMAKKTVSAKKAAAKKTVTAKKTGKGGGFAKAKATQADALGFFIRTYSSF